MKPPLRGLTLDAARLVERLDFYERFLDFCAEWDINAVLFRLTDDEGCAIRFQSHPELITHRHALDADEVRQLVRHAKARGLTLIPEVESFGHSQYITTSPAHTDLWDRPEGDNPYGGVIPLHPKTLRIFSDLYAEVAALFPGPYLHAGCDETHWGGSAFSQELLKTRGHRQVWGEYLGALHERIRALGREMIIWDDMVLQREPEILEYVDRRILLHDWNYWGTDPLGVTSRLALAREKGFRVIGGPAAIYCRWGPRAGRPQLENLAAYAGVYREADPSVALGVIVTHWCPARFLSRAQWDTLAFAAVALSEGPEAARQQAFRRFVERHYGALWDDRWAYAFQQLYDWTPTRHGNDPIPLLAPWASDEELDAAVRGPALPSGPYASLLQTLDELRPSVRRNVEDFQALRLTVAYLAHLYWRHQRVRGLEGDALESALTEVAGRDAEMAEALTADWRASRPGDPRDAAERASLASRHPHERLHAAFLAAAEYSAQRAGVNSRKSPRSGIKKSSGLPAAPE